MSERCLVLGFTLPFMKRLALLVLTALTACSTAPEPAPPVTAPPPLTAVSPPLLGATPDKISGCYDAVYTIKHSMGDLAPGRLSNLLCIYVTPPLPGISSMYDIYNASPLLAVRLPLMVEVNSNALVLGVYGQSTPSQTINILMNFPLGTPEGAPWTGTFNISENPTSAQGATGTFAAGTVVITKRFRPGDGPYPSNGN